MSYLKGSNTVSMRLPISLLFTLLFSICVITAFAQNTKDYFRVYPSVLQDDDLPQWASAMYSEDPDVYNVIELYHTYYKDHSFVKTMHTQNYKYWLKKVYGNLDENGKIRFPSIEEVSRSILNQEIQIQRKQKSERSATTWANIGPFETYKKNTVLPISWQSNVYAIDQSYNDTNILICGTEHGGVFKTTDRGMTWDLISSNATFCNSVTSVAIHPQDDDTYFVGAQGVVYSTTDGGVTWSMEYNTGGDIHEIKFDPTNSNHMFAVGNAGLFESADGGSSWAQVFSETSWDIDYHPTNGNIIYLLKENTSLKKQEFYKSTNNGNSWTLISNGWYVPQNASQANVYGGKIGVSLDDPNRVYAALIGDSKSGDDGWIGVYKSTDAGDTWTLPSGQIGGPYSNCNVGNWNIAAYCNSNYHQGFYNFDFEISPSDADLMWIATIRLTESRDGAATFQSIGSSGSVRHDNIHADVQAIHVNGSDIWVTTDGGVDYSNDNLLTHTSRKYGISASAYWGFGMGWNEDVMVGGRYHNGNAVLFDSYGVGNSQHVGGVEEPTGYVNVMNNLLAYFGYYYANTDGSSTTMSKVNIPNTLGGNSTSTTMNFRPNEHYVPWETSPFTHHPNYADYIVAGLGGAIWQTKNAGALWDVLYDFGAGGYVTEIEYCRSNPKCIYALYRIGGSNTNTRIYKTTDGGLTWNMITTPPTNNSRRFTITVNPADENEIWAAAPRGANGSKVYRSLDGGSSWINVTTSVLDNQNVHDIEYHGGSNGVVYLLNRNNYFYYDPGTNSWIQYNTDLPFNLSDGEIKTTKLFYRDSKIRLSSSRGIWEVDFPLSFAPVADPMTHVQDVNCGDVVQFESHSMADHSNATWTWNITPAPQSITNPNTRNPQVVFGAKGYYDVSLTVTNNNGTHTKVVQQMIFANGNCTCPPAYSTANGNKLVGVQSHNVDYETDGIIQSDQVIDIGTSVFYDSSSSIELQSGFRTEDNALFQAFIDGCGNLFNKKNDE